MTHSILVTAVALLLGCSAAAAQEKDALTGAGKVEYLSACAGCHGMDATGDGPMADLMNIETPDLTRLAKRAGDTFPFRRTLLMIDGRDEVRAHGGEMPVWGDRFAALARSQRGETADMVVAGRMLSLVYYLESIQQE